MPVLGGLFGWTLSSWGFYLFIMVIVMIPQVLINIYGIKLTAKLNDFSVYWHIVGVLVIACCWRSSARTTSRSRS